MQRTAQSNPPRLAEPWLVLKRGGKSMNFLPVPNLVLLAGGLDVNKLKLTQIQVACICRKNVMT